MAKIIENMHKMHMHYNVHVEHRDQGFELVLINFNYLTFKNWNTSNLPLTMTFTLIHTHTHIFPESPSAAQLENTWRP